jgi:hypothetical protein
MIAQFLLERLHDVVVLFSCGFFYLNCIYHIDIRCDGSSESKARGTGSL